MNKNLFKKISLGVLGIGILGGCITLFSHFMNNSDKTLHLDYDIGALTDQGKYLEDECKLYTKKAFACEGLRVTFDFDAEVNGQFYFYDINDKYLSKSDVITEGTSVSVPQYGAYARAVVIPTNDEDGSISFTEKYKYASQMQVKVDKKAESNVSNKFKSLNGFNYEVVYNVVDAKFNYGRQIADDFNSVDHGKFSSTTTNLIDISPYKTLNVDFSSMENGTTVDVYLFSDIDSINYIKFNMTSGESIKFDEKLKNSKYMLLGVYCDSADELKTKTNNLYKFFTLK